MSAGNGRETDVMRSARRSASLVFDKIMDGAEQLPSSSDGFGWLDGSPDRGSTDRAWTDVTTLLVATLADQVSRRTVPRGQPPASAGGHASSGEIVELQGVAGTTALGSVWVHTDGTVDVSGMSLIAPELVGHDGSRLPTRVGDIAVDPTGRRSPAGSARIEVSIPSSAPDGVYHGIILASGWPDAKVAVRLLVGKS